MSIFEAYGAFKDYRMEILMILGRNVEQDETT